MTVNIEIAASLTLTAITLGAGMWLRRRRRTAVPVPVPVTREPENVTEMISRMRASLIDLRQQLEVDPFKTSSQSGRTKVLLLHRCGMPLSEIAEHLNLPRFEVDLIVQVASHDQPPASVNVVRS
jgi:hypothetical protein